MQERLKRGFYRVAYPWAAIWFGFVRPSRPGAKCILECEGQFLLIRHTYGNRRRWELPGGGAKRGEDPAATARREVREELGVDVAQLRPLASRVFSAGERGHPVHFFHGQLASREVRRDPVELAAVAWFAPEELPRPLAPFVAEMVKLAREPVR